jgi:hypothetical protein
MICQMIENVGQEQITEVMVLSCVYRPLLIVISLSAAINSGLF